MHAAEQEEEKEEDLERYKKKEERSGRTNECAMSGRGYQKALTRPSHQRTFLLFILFLDSPI